MVDYSKYPDENGFFNQYGGRFVSETLIAALDSLTENYPVIFKSNEFQQEFNYLLENYVGRPSPLYFARRSTERMKGAKIYLKREDLNHTGAHKINNALGQALLAKSMGKKRLIAETGAGQHGVATATVAALLDLECVVYMGSKDIKRQAANMCRMKLLGAQVIPVNTGSKTLKDALNEALRDWVATVDETFYVIGTVAGPHPYPKLVRDLQTVIGQETKKQIIQQAGRLPNTLVACVGGGSNAIGLFYPFLENENISMYGVEPTGKGLASNKHAAPLLAGKKGVLHGNRTYLLMDEDGQIAPTYSISAGLDYPGVGPEHAWLKDIGRVNYVGISDDEALQAFHNLSTYEGIIPALESSHALAFACQLAAKMQKDDIIIVSLSGRGDKDIALVSEYFTT